MNYNEYYVLSSLLKKRAIPTLDSSGENAMLQIDMDVTITTIQKDICSFDYDAIIVRLNNENGMYLLYRNASNNYEKYTAI